MNPKEKKHKEYHRKTHHSQIAENKNENLESTQKKK